MTKQTFHTPKNKIVKVVQEIDECLSLVQNVGVSGGKQVPMGAPYSIEKSKLFDEPVECWGEKNLRDREDRSRRELASMIERVREEEKKLRTRIRLAKNHFEYLNNLTGNENVDESISRVVDFMTGQYQFIYRRSQADVVPLFGLTGDDNPAYLKLINLFGKTGGELGWQISRYNDGSGDYEGEIVPFKTKKEALIYAQKLLDAEVARIAEIPAPSDSDHWTLSKMIKCAGLDTETNGAMELFKKHEKAELLRRRGLALKSLQGLDEKLQELD